MDLKDLHNPYDFANPVSDQALFAGRDAEMQDIKYYLAHASTGARPINIALLGPRASGKTSILNMTAMEGQRRGFCVVRVNLDEDDGTWQLRFFHKLFDCILTTACEFGAFGGLSGKTFDTYLDMTNAYSIPEDKIFCPFIFPLQYAKAMAIGNLAAVVSDEGYKRDLLKVQSELARPVLVLFDEGNVLAHSRVHLQKLRNIFMDVSGFMLVLTGTPDLFPVIDDVFSPIVRQFKKINVGQFQEQSDTQACMKKPLEKLAIKAEEIFDFETYRDVREIHDLSGGRPYEIQLICHSLFRRVQEGRAKRMKLDISVLEDVRNELESAQDINFRPILVKVRNLSERQLHALGLFCLSDCKANFEQLWAVEYACHGNSRWTRVELCAQLEAMIDEGILSCAGGVIGFVGDDFDRIYAKYFAREKNVDLSFLNMGMDVIWQLRIQSVLGSAIGVEPIPSLTGSELGKRIDAILAQLEGRGAGVDLFDSRTFPVFRSLYFMMLQCRERQQIRLCQLFLSAAGIKTEVWSACGKSCDDVAAGCLCKPVQAMAARIGDLGGSVTLQDRLIDVVPVESLVGYVESSEIDWCRKLLAQDHALRMATEYLESDEVAEAEFHARLCYRYRRFLGAPLSNNPGYLFIAIGEFSMARELLESAVANARREEGLALTMYNLGILEAREGNYAEALARWRAVTERGEEFGGEGRYCRCLFVPCVSAEGRLAFEETRDRPDVIETAARAKSVVEGWLSAVHDGPS